MNLYLFDNTSITCINERCYTILKNLNLLVKEEIERLSNDYDVIIGILEISLYHLDNMEYNLLATDLICTNIMLNSIIRMYEMSNIDILNDKICDYRINNSFVNTNSNSYSELEYKYQNEEYSGSDLDDLKLKLSVCSDSCSDLYSESESGSEQNSNFDFNSVVDFYLDSNTYDYNNKNSAFKKEANTGIRKVGNPEYNTGENEEKKVNGEIENKEYKHYTNLCLSNEHTGNRNLFKKSRKCPVSILFRFVTDYFDSNSNIFMNYIGMYNYCKILYSLLLFDMDWTLINVLTFDESYIINNLILSLTHESVLNLLKIVLIVICEYKLINKLELVNQKKNKNEHMDNTNLSRSEVKCQFSTCNYKSNIHILTKLLVYNLRVYQDEISGCEYYNGVDSGGNNISLISDSYNNKIMLINKTSDFINDIVENTVDINSIFYHFKYNKICDSIFDSPFSIDNKLNRWLMMLSNDKLFKHKFQNTLICFEFILSLSSREIFGDLINIVLASVKNFTVNKENTFWSIYYSNLFKCSLSIINSMFNCGSNSLFKTLNNNNKYFKIIDNIKKLISVKQKNQLTFYDKIKFEFDRNKILNWKLSNNVLIPITRTYILEMVNELYDDKKEEFIENVQHISILSERKESIVTILIEFFNYIGIALINNQLEFVNRLLSELSYKSKFPVIFEIFDTIIFSDDKSSNDNIIEDTVHYLFKVCISYFNYSKIRNIKHNISRNARFLFIYQYLNSSFIFNLSKAKLNETACDFSNDNKLNKSQLDIKNSFNEYVTSKFLDSRMLKRTNNSFRNKDKYYSGIIVSCSNDEIDGDNITCFNNKETSTTAKSAGSLSDYNNYRASTNLDDNVCIENATNNGNSFDLNTNSSINTNTRKRKYNIPRIPKMLLNELYSIRKEIFESSNLEIIERMFLK